MGCYFGFFQPRDAAEDLTTITKHLKSAINQLLTDREFFLPEAPSTYDDDAPVKILNPIISNADFQSFLKAYRALHKKLQRSPLLLAETKKQNLKSLTNTMTTLITILDENPQISKDNLQQTLALLSDHVEKKFNSAFNIHPKLRTALFVAGATLAFAAFIVTLVFLPFIHLAVLPAVAIAVGALLVTGGSGYKFYGDMQKKETHLAEAKSSIKESVDNFLSSSRKMIV